MDESVEWVTELFGVPEQVALTTTKTGSNNVA